MARTKAQIEAFADRMAVLIAKGYTQADAWRELKPKTRKRDPQTIAKHSSAFAIKYGISGRVARIRAEMRPQELYSVAQWIQDSIEQRNKALDAKNYNAAGGYQRQIGQAIGAIGGDSATTVVLAEKLSDSALIQRLAGSNPQLAAMLADALGVAEPSKPQDVVPASASGSASKLTH